MKIIAFADIQRLKSRRDAGRLEARVAEIAEVLMELGGGAHRELVISRLAWRRNEQPASESLTAEYIDAFEAHVTEVTARGMTPIFHQPFGPGSHRWALTPEASIHLHRGQAQA
jgi:hypothetical protein